VAAVPLHTKVILPAIPHIYTPEHEQHLRELKLPTGAARIALLTFISSHPVNHEPTNGTRDAQRLFSALRGNSCLYGEMTDGTSFAKATADAGKWMTECALWIGEGLVYLGEALREWGKSAARDPAGAWEEIKDAVVEALNFLKNWLLNAIEFLSAGLFYSALVLRDIISLEPRLKGYVESFITGKISVSEMLMIPMKEPSILLEVLKLLIFLPIVLAYQAVSAGLIVPFSFLLYDDFDETIIDSCFGAYAMKEEDEEEEEETPVEDVKKEIEKVFGRRYFSSTVFKLTVVSGILLYLSSMDATGTAQTTEFLLVVCGIILAIPMIILGI